MYGQTRINEPKIFEISPKIVSVLDTRQWYHNIKMNKCKKDNLVHFMMRSALDNKLLHANDKSPESGRFLLPIV